jgi:dCTP deaminase
MALGNKEILRHMEEGNIVIDPFDRHNLATSSYDVRLGEWFFRQTRQNMRVFNIWSREQTSQVWGDPREARPLSKVRREYPDSNWEGIRLAERVIMIGPGETILGHTREFIGGRNCITTKMQARSSMGRVGIEVCKCAGWGDVGFINRWTMEITNNSQNYWIPLVVGRRIAQIVFFHTGEIEGNDYTVAGKYQSATDLDELKASWEPSMMLPRLYKDREVRNPNEVYLPTF